MEHVIKIKDVSRETLDYVSAVIEAYENKLNEYADLLLWWNEKVNLLSRKTTKEEIEKHIVHSMLISVAGTFPKEKHLVDIGTGGGLPGIPLAIGYPEKEFILIDKVSKKVAAIKDICSQLGLNNVICVAVDFKMFHVEHPFSYISKHAFKLNDFLKSAEGKSWNKAYFLKGEDYRLELEEVEIPLIVMGYKLEALMKDPFYQGKYLLSITKK